MKNYVDSPPRTASDRIEFVKDNAPKIVDGIAMIQRYLNDIKSKTNSKKTIGGIDAKEVIAP